MQKPCHSNITNPFSRLQSKREELATHEHDTEDYLRFVALQATPNALSTREIEEVSVIDEELIEVRKAVQTDDYRTCKPYHFVPGKFCVRAAGPQVNSYCHSQHVATESCRTRTCRISLSGWNQTEPRYQRMVAWSC